MTARCADSATARNARSLTKRALSTTSALTTLPDLSICKRISTMMSRTPCNPGSTFQQASTVRRTASSWLEVSLSASFGAELEAGCDDAACCCRCGWDEDDGGD